MRRTKRGHAILLAAVWLVAGCVSQTNVSPRQSMHIVWKTPTLKYADMAFVRHGDNRIDIELYSVANPLTRMSLTRERVCTASGVCMPAEDFVKRYLSAAYPADTLYRIFKAKPIFQKRHLHRVRHGFTQHIKKSGKYDISYSVLKNRVVFHDTINRISVTLTKG